MDGLEPNHKLTREQKVGVTMLFIFALFTAGLAFLQMRNNLVTPFVLRAQQEQGEKSLKDFQVELQHIDTDQDGINDYEELNFYGTSPYLPDTDSDTKPDKAEIEAGTDPLCAEGKQCESTDTIIPSASSTPAFTSLPLGQITASLPLGANVDLEAAAKDIDALLNDPRKIRQLLQQTGQIPEAQLNQLDDATLIKILKDILSQSPPTAASQNAPTPSTTPSSTSSFPR